MRTLAVMTASLEIVPRVRHVDWYALGIFAALVTPVGACGLQDLAMRVEIPAGLLTSRVLLGEEDFVRSEFLKAAPLGVVSDIRWSREGESLLVVGERGAWLVSMAGKAEATLAFDSGTGHVEAVRSSPHQPFRFLNRGGGWQPVALFDDRGARSWSYGPSPAPNDVSPGDLDGDGTLEFVVGMNGGGGVRALDENGAHLWTKSDGNVWHVEVLDVDGDDKPEIVHSNASGFLTIRNADGDVLDRVEYPSYVSDFQMLWRGDEPIVLAADEEVAYFYALDGSILRELEAPLASDGMTPFGTFVSLDEENEPSFALLMEMAIWERSVLYLFSPEGELLYHEVLDDDCREVFALSRRPGEVETILLGCTGAVREYAPRP